MSIETAFVAMCEAAVTIGSPAAAIATGPHPVALPQGFTGVTPGMTYQVITAPRDYVMEGADGVTTFRFQLDIYAAKYNQVRAVRDALADAMSGAFAEWHDGVLIKGCFIDNERDNIGGELGSTELRLYRKTLDFMVTAEQR